MDAPKETVIAYKGFNADWTCNGFQYEVGKTYALTGKIKRCELGFHACEHPFHIWDYYAGAGITSPAAIVELSGDLDRETDGDSKIASAEITIKAELKLPDIIKHGVKWILSRAETNKAAGDSGHAAATGKWGHAAATGYSSHAAAAGDSGHAAATGKWGHAAAAGDSGHAAATGKWGHAAATGDSGHAAATGDSGHAAATGDRGHAAATGDSGHAAATGDRGHAAATGKWGIAASFGPNATAKAGLDGWIVLSSWRWTGKEHELLHVRSAKVGGVEGIQADTVYRLTEGGDFEVVT